MGIGGEGRDFVCYSFHAAWTERLSRKVMIGRAGDNGPPLCRIFVSSGSDDSRWAYIDENRPGDRSGDKNWPRTNCYVKPPMTPGIDSVRYVLAGPWTWQKSAYCLI